MNKLALFSFIKDEIDFMGDFLDHHVPIFDEINIIDTGSTDGSLQLLTEYAKKYNINIIVGETCFSKKADACSFLMKQSNCDILVPLDADEKIIYDNGKIQNKNQNVIRSYLQNLPTTGEKYKIRNSYEYNPFDEELYGANEHTKIIFPKKTFMYTDGGFHRGRTMLDEDSNFDDPVYWRKFISGNIKTDKVINIDISYIHYHFKTKEIWLKNTIKKLKARLGNQWDNLDVLKKYKGPSIHSKSQYLKFIETDKWFQARRNQIFLNIGSDPIRIDI